MNFTQKEKSDFALFSSIVFFKQKIMNVIEVLSIPQSESDVPVELNTITSKEYVGVKHRAFTSKRGELN